jgi:hypothetical protein
MKRFILNSGGKDSMATTIIDFEKNGYGGIVDGVVMGELMFSHKNNIPAEHPLTYKWKHEVAIPKLKEMGFNVIIVKSEHDYLSLFHKRYTRSKDQSKNGKKWGWAIASMCHLKLYGKILAMDNWCKQQGEFEKIVGYAYDETKRIEGMLKTKNMSSILYDNKIVEAQTFDICRPYNLLSPIYDTKKRDGCWFCPNQSIEDMAKFAKEYPHYWALLEELADEKEMANENFSFGKTFKEVNEQIKGINSRLTLFDFMNN